MVSLFADPKNLPIECIHTHHQYPYTVRVVSPWVVQSGMRLDVKESSTEKSFRKYFGKNVRNLTCIQNTPSFNPGYRCKFLKTIRFHSLPKIIPHYLSQIENLHITESNLWFYDRYQEDFKRKGRPGFGKLTSQKCLKYLEADFGWLDISLKPLRVLTTVQMLSLTMNEDMFMKNYRVMLSLKALKKLNLSIISTRTENTLTDQSEFPVFSDFLTYATKSKKLDFLGLKLITLFDKLGSDSKLKFFESLNKVDIPAFSIELTDMDVCSIDPQILRSCTHNVDLLELDLEKDISVEIVCRTENITWPTQRKLKMSFKLCTNSMQTQDHYLSQTTMLGALQDEGDSSGSETNLELQNSKRLNLSSKLGILTKNCFGLPFSLSRESTMGYLKSFSFNFARMIETVSEEIDQVLLTILKNESNLEHLQLQRDIGCCSTKLNVYHCFSMISRAPAIQNLTSLYLIDFSVQENFFMILSEVFGNLKHLKVLRLDLQIKDPIDNKTIEKDNLIIPKNSKLTEMHLKLPKLEEDMISDFIKLILSLHELEDLTLLSGNQLIEADTNRLFVLDGFKKLVKLRNVSILRGIDENKKSSFPFGVRNDHRHPIVAKVLSELKQLYDSNCSLWKFCIESNAPPYQIRYKRY